MSTLGIIVAMREELEIVLERLQEPQTNLQLPYRRADSLPYLIET